jgi:hypothetical protein
MRVDGQWFPCDDGIVRPTVQAFVRSSNGAWVETIFLLDAGADQTVFRADLLPLLQPLDQLQREPTGLAGIGGGANAITLETAISFTRDDGQRVTIRGAFCVFTEIESSDLSILGRDVTNNFGVIYDYPNRVVALLAPPHSYEIKTT